MTSGILSIKNQVQHALEKARESIKGVDENLSKFTRNTYLRSHDESAPYRDSALEPWDGVVRSIPGYSRVVYNNYPQEYARRAGGRERDYNDGKEYSRRDREQDEDHEELTQRDREYMRDRQLMMQKDREYAARDREPLPARDFVNYGGEMRDRGKIRNLDGFKRTVDGVKRAYDGNEAEHVPIKKRLGPKVVQSNLVAPKEDYQDHDEQYAPTLSSQVVLKSNPVPSRMESKSIKTYTDTKDRDRRMFVNLLQGTLKKFCQEENQLKDKVEKRAKVEKKVEEDAKKEKERMRKERFDLMKQRQQEEKYAGRLEETLEILKNQEKWEEMQKPLMNYIRTKTRPHLYYIPKEHNEASLTLLEESKKIMKELIEENGRKAKEQVDAIVEGSDSGALAAGNKNDAKTHSRRDERSKKGGKREVIKMKRKASKGSESTSSDDESEENLSIRIKVEKDLEEEGNGHVVSVPQEALKSEPNRE